MNKVFVKPQYNIDDFIHDCAIGISKVFVIRGAVQSAREDFNLNTQHQILKCIGDGGIQNKQFINCKPWANNPDKTVEILVDAYAFYLGSIYAYLAFFYQPNTEKWIVKSFKKNQERDPRNLALQEPLSKLFNPQ